MNVKKIVLTTNKNQQDFSFVNIQKSCKIVRRNILSKHGPQYIRKIPVCFPAILVILSVSTNIRNFWLTPWTSGYGTLLLQHFYLCWQLFDPILSVLIVFLGNWIRVEISPSNLDLHTCTIMIFMLFRRKIHMLKNC